MINGGLRIIGNEKKYKNGFPIITIITVVYNAATILEKTIRSVINQSYQNIEYIIIDGNSQDGTLDVIKQYEEKIDYWQSEPDKGIYDAMNKAIELSTGQWISFMNAGDLFYDNETIKSVFVSEKMYSGYNIIYGNTILQWDGFTEIKNPGRDSEMPFCHQSCFTKLSLLKKYKFDLKYRIHYY